MADAPFEVALGLIPLCERTCAFQDNLGPLVAEGQMLRSRFVRNGDGPLVQEQAITLVLDRKPRPSVHRVVFDEVGEGSGVREVVDPHDFDLWVPHDPPHCQSPDASEPVDGKLHDIPSFSYPSPNPDR
jgi:hypothetical protein